MASEPIAEGYMGASAADLASARATSEAERSVAFRRLAEEHLEVSYRLASAILGDPSEAQDAVHDAFVSAWRKWETLRDQAKFEPWFRSIVVNTCRNQLKRRRRHPTIMLPTEAVVPVGDQTSVVQDHAVLDRAFERLTPDDKVVIILRYFLDLTTTDIASLLDVRPGTVGSRLNRAQGRLREALEEAHAAENVR